MGGCVPASLRLCFLIFFRRLVKDEGDNALHDRPKWRDHILQILMDSRYP